MEEVLQEIKKIEKWLIQNSSNQNIDLLTRMQIKLSGYKSYLCGIIGELDVELAMSRKTRKVKEGEIWNQERNDGATASASDTIARRKTAILEAEEILIEGSLSRIKRHIEGITTILESTRQRVAYLRDESNRGT